MDLYRSINGVLSPFYTGCLAYSTLNRNPATREIEEISQLSQILIIDCLQIRLRVLFNCCRKCEIYKPLKPYDSLFVLHCGHEFLNVKANYQSVLT